MLVWACWGLFGRVWARLGSFGLVCACLGMFALVWARLGLFGLWKCCFGAPSLPVFPFCLSCSLLSLRLGFLVLFLGGANKLLALALAPLTLVIGLPSQAVQALRCGLGKAG